MAVEVGLVVVEMAREGGASVVVASMAGVVVAGEALVKVAVARVVAAGVRVRVVGTKAMAVAEATGVLVRGSRGSVVLVGRAERVRADGLAAMTEGQGLLEVAMVLEGEAEEVAVSVAGAEEEAEALVMEAVSKVCGSRAVWVAVVRDKSAVRGVEAWGVVAGTVEVGMALVGQEWAAVARKVVVVAVEVVLAKVVEEVVEGAARVAVVERWMQASRLAIEVVTRRWLLGLWQRGC